MIILTNNFPNQWEQTIQEAQSRFSDDLSLFQPRFITYNELLFLEEDAWYKYKLDITQGQKNQIIVVVQTKRNQMQDFLHQKNLNFVDRQDLIRKNSIVLIPKDESPNI
ncbi:hypothetical protein PTI45_03802 [Paenibacillus nuruki]|uniref:Uncharacterized protein n=1 Tax=Paenibacillus nuruki TaxID=1886670 RepID=A0A1E3KZQ2_9BACL|nr:MULTISPECIES: hypothetical protein [Paenibacillus]ODP26841.1 hypothetical protein PTI45_03802 [Paenibacillus nuruki]TKJ87230.1 hypothetical protein PaeCFBP13512_18585 [Paenibacillus sp. CFBP13512]